MVELTLPKNSKIIEGKVFGKKKKNSFCFNIYRWNRESGQNPRIDKYYIDKINKIKSNSSILLSGPSGIGKNYTANFIHMKLSSNNPDTFINMNENLMNENDLFKFSSLHCYLHCFFRFTNGFSKL